MKVCIKERYPTTIIKHFHPCDCGILARKNLRAFIWNPSQFLLMKLFRDGSFERHLQNFNVAESFLFGVPR